MATASELANGGDRGGLKIINAALFRMATKSMARAYQILGYKVHHGLLENMMDSPWAGIEQAAEATWPSVREPGAPPRPPFQRSDWDAVWGSKYDAVTDLASPFALELIKAYPDAKVVVVQRDFDSWWGSFKPQVLDHAMVQPMVTIYAFILWRIMGIRGVHAMRKVHFGFFNASTPDEVAAHARQTYDAYYREIRKQVPPERRLEYKMGDGWEPLCAFLGVPVPEGVEFPRENDKASHEKEGAERLKQIYTSFAKVAIPCAIGCAAVAVGWMYL